MRFLGLAALLVAFSAHAEVPVEGTMNIRMYVDTQTITTIADDAFDQTYLSFGGQFAWDHFALDLAHGVKDIDCGNCQWDIGGQNGSLLGIRVYPSNLQVVRPYLSYQHISDLFRGPPFDRDEAEPTVDYISVGVTFARFDRVQVDVAYGRGSLDCAYLNGGACNWDDSVQIRVKTFIGRTHTFKTL